MANMDKSSEIIKPISAELVRFDKLYDDALSGDNGVLGQVLTMIGRGRGKLLRPKLTMLLTKAFSHDGNVTDEALLGALSLELLHTASLVHDDVVDESDKRRGQPSINKQFGNKVAVLSGDFVLSTSLHVISFTHNANLFAIIGDLGRTLSHGELQQLENISKAKVTEADYLSVIEKKTAALFVACAKVAIEVTKVNNEIAEKMKRFALITGLIFQIKDDILDYVSDAKSIGKPTGNDLREGKVTLPLIHALDINPDVEMLSLVAKAKNLEATDEEIAKIISFTIKNGGIEYAEDYMLKLRNEAAEIVNSYCKNDGVGESLVSYVDYAIQRSK